MEGGYKWASDFDQYIKEKIIGKQYQDVMNYHSAGLSAQQSFNTPEHFYPLLYILGASKAEDKLAIFNDSCVLGSLSMTSYLFG
jgi:4,5-DOPA dioxygenase extradiol